MATGRSSEICLAAVKKNGWALGYVPREMKTHEICLAAVKQDGEALEIVRGEMKTSVKIISDLSFGHLSGDNGSRLLIRSDS